MKTKRILAMLLCAVMLLTMIPVVTLTVGAAEVEGDWTTLGDPDEEEEEEEDEEPGTPAPGYEYTADGCTIIQPDYTNCSPYFCIRTKDKVPCGLFIGYYLDEEKTHEAWHDGYYHTGDQATMDEDGYLWYVGRIDDVIKSSGYRIGPFEIESVIMELPYVLECAVTPVPDEVRGQIVKATIVLVKGTEGSDALKKEIQDYVKTHTAPYKYPRIVEFVDELPKTISGKVRRVEIRKNDLAKLNK